MKKICLLLGAFIFTGCATSSKIHLPDGSLGYNISCDGSALSFAQCYKKAGQLCGEKGYTLLLKDGEKHNVGYSQGTASGSYDPYHGGGGNAQYTSTYGAFVSRDIYIQCNEAKTTDDL